MSIREREAQDMARNDAKVAYEAALQKGLSEPEARRVYEDTYDVVMMSELLLDGGE